MHTLWILPQGLVGVLAAAIRPLPHVTTVLGGDVFALRGRLPSRLLSLVLQRADAVTVNSSATESAVITLAPGLTHMRRIPLGVSLDRPIATTSSAEIAARNRRGAGPLIIFTGRLVSEKGVEDLIRAVALLRERLPETHALILGEGQARAALQGLTHELGLAHRLRLAAAQRVRQHYSRPAAAESFSRLYAELLNSHRPLRGIDSDPYPR